MRIINNLEVYGVIYKITNKVNNKVYIGQTTIGFNKRYRGNGVGIERVYNFHKSLQLKDNNYNVYLLKSIEKYGFKNFKVSEIIDFAFSEDELDIKEKCWISIYKSWDMSKGYNIQTGGKNKERVGRRLICMNDNMHFISYKQAIEYYNNFGFQINKDYIKSTLKLKYKHNKDKLIFRFDCEKMKGRIYCENCGRPVKLLYKNQSLCPKCNKSVKSCYKSKTL